MQHLKGAGHHHIKAVGGIALTKHLLTWPHPLADKFRGQPAQHRHLHPMEQGNRSEPFGRDAHPMAGADIEATHLAVPEVGIEAALCEQSVVVAQLNNPAIGDDGHLIHRRGRPQPVQHGDHGASLAQAGQGAIDGLFGARVQGAGGLIEQQQLGVANNRASDGNALTLTA